MATPVARFPSNSFRSDLQIQQQHYDATSAIICVDMDAKYELLQRGQYSVNVAPADLKPIPLDKDTPQDLHEARNAVRIARWAGAEKDASESFQKADKLLQQAEATKPGRREINR